MRKNLWIGGAALALMVIVGWSVRLDAAEVRIWDRDAAAWTTNFSAGDPIDTGSNDNVSDPHLAADSMGRVYAAFEQGEHIYLSRYDGIDVRIWDHDATNWTTHFSDGDPIDTGMTNGVAGVELAVDGSNRVYVVYTQSDGANSRLHINCYDGVSMRIWDADTTNWTATLGAGDPVDTGPGYTVLADIALAVDGADRLTIAFRQNSAAGYRPYLCRYNGTDVRLWDRDTQSWTATFADGDAVASGNALNVALAVDGLDTLYACYREYRDGAYHVYLVRHDGTDVRLWDNDAPGWTTNFNDGDPIDLGEAKYAIPSALAVDASNRVYCAFVQATTTGGDPSGYRPYLSRYDGADARIWDNDAPGWTTNFSAGDPVTGGDITYYGPAMAIDSADRVYLAQTEPKSNPRVYLSRYDGADVRMWDHDATAWTTNFSLADPVDSGNAAESMLPYLAVDSLDHVFIAYGEGGSFSGKRFHLSRHDGAALTIRDTDAGAWTSTLSQGDPLDNPVADNGYPLAIVSDAAAGVTIASLHVNFGGSDHILLHRYQEDPPVAEIDPPVASINTNQAFSYYIQAEISPVIAAIDTIDMPLPAGYANLSVTGVSTGGVSATYADFSSGNAVAVTLTAPVTVDGTVIRIDFTADTPPLPATQAFAARVDHAADPGSVFCQPGDGDGGGIVTTDVWTVTVEADGPVTSAEAEIDPIRVVLNTQGVSFSYYIDPVIGPHDTGFDTIRIDAPPVYSNLSVTGVSVGGAPAGYAGSVDGGTITVTLSNRVTAGGTDIRVDFTADAPDGIDWGLNFTSTLDDSTVHAPMACVSGDGDGNGPVTGNTWTVRAEPAGYQFVQTAWLEGQYASISNLYSGSGTELLLTSDPTNLVPIGSILNMGQASQIPQVYGMAVYDGKLYMLGCEYPLNAHDGTAYTHAYWMENEDGAARLRVLRENGTNYLVAVGIEQEYGANLSEPVRLYVFDGTGWTPKQVDNPGSKEIHGWDVAVFDDALYSISAHSDYATLYRAQDDFLGNPAADTVAWSELFDTPSDSTRSTLATHDGDLYLMNSYHLYRSDGSLFMPSADLTGAGWAMASRGGYLYIGDKGAILRTDGVTITNVADTANHYCWYLKEHDGVLYAAVSDTDSSRSFLGDNVDNAQLWRLNDGSGRFEKVWEGPEDSAHSLGSYRGRLFMGTGGQGNIYAGAFSASGFLISNPYDTGLSAVRYDQLAFSGSVPANATLRFQIRTASTEAGLESATFVGPDGTAGSWYAVGAGEAIPGGHDDDPWLQYQVWFETQDTTNATPVLNSVSITYTDPSWHQLPFVETFESNAPMAGTLGAVDGQHGWTGDAGAVVQDADAYEFCQAARVADANLSHVFEGGPADVWMAVAWKPAAGDPPPVDTIPSNTTVVIWAGSNSVLSAYSNQTVVSSGAVVDTGRWSRVLVHSDYAAKRWDLWLDGVQAITNYGFYADTLSGFTGVTFTASDPAVQYVDDVRIGTDAWNPSPGDTDGDGMADDWERDYWQSPNVVSNSAGDYDGDGASNEGEGIAGTDPTEAGSVFMITNITTDAAGSNLVLRWPSVSDRVYGVWWTTNLLTNFTGMASNLPATPPENVYTDALHGAVRENFYRIGVDWAE